MLLSKAGSENLVKFQVEANGAGEGRRKNMLEFSSPLRSSGFHSSNYTEVLPDAPQHRPTQRNHVSAQIHSVLHGPTELSFSFP
ncbi:unnamed protein product [Pleuronectes platessa]|uniref:Uncharacterized protein n=1 Tax=Pleuronectes platessa TaxID=8262 RepID=A0A9N7THY7_PLEPL|nr:unnamed protein product [Pleuronectes platessa]